MVKVMVCAKLLIGDSGALAMPPDVLRQFFKDKISALGNALDLARSLGAEQCVIAGGLFAKGFVPQSFLEGALSELGSHELPVTWLPLEGEAVDVAARVAIPELVTIVREPEIVALPGMRVLHEDQNVELEVDFPDERQRRVLDPLEPMGFGDLATANFLMLEISDGVVAKLDVVPSSKHPFVHKVIHVDKLTSSKKLRKATEEALEGLDPKTCLHLSLRGCAPLDSYFNPTELQRVLNERYFYAEVVNECSVDCEGFDPASDVSLMAEFIGLVEEDDTLSLVEKARVERCCWNALNGKDLVE